MKNWTKQLAAGFLTVMLGAGGFMTPATAAAAAGYVLYEREDNLSPDEIAASVGDSSSASKANTDKAWKKSK